MQNQKTKYYIYLIAIATLAVLIGFYMGYRKALYTHATTYTERSNGEEAIGSLLLNSQKYKVNQLLNYISGIYIDNIDIDTLTESFLPKIVEKLDPHSLYIPAKEVAAANENLEGSFDGIGISFNMVTDTLIILDVISGGPSSKVGMEMGDKIIKIEGENIAGIKADQNEVVKKLRGKGGSTVKISVERAGFKDLIDFSIIRGKVAINSIEAAIMLKPKIGYIKLIRFARSTHSEMSKAIDSLKKLGMESLILDLKSNSGGYLDQAINIANEFLPKGSSIVYTEGRGKVLAKQLSDGSGRFTDHDLYVLIDEFSASSSEIVAGALQDNDRGTIIGRRSYGKGLVQQQVPFTDGSVMNITIARYHTPSGRCIQKPYKLGAQQEYDNELIERFKNKEYLSADSVSVADTVKYYTKAGRVVYGGGGIMPDIFVPLDTTAFSPFMRKAIAGMNIIKYITKYSAAHSKEFVKLNSIDKVKAFVAQNSDAIFNGYVDFMIANKVITNHSQAQNSKKELIPYLSAYIGQYTPMGSNAFYALIYELDDITKKSIEIIESKRSKK